MFERFTDNARQTIIRAQQEATELHHPKTGTEHLLLALLADPGTGGTVLREAGVAPDAVRADLARLVGPAAPLLDEKDAEALRSVGIDLDAVVARIKESFGPEALRPPAPGGRGWLSRRSWPGRFSPRSKKVLELSLREAVRLHGDHIDSGHILLGLLRENGGLAARILADTGVNVDELRGHTEQALKDAA